MARHRCRRRRRCPECGSRCVSVRYETVVGARPAVLNDPVQIGCTNRSCPRSWR